jgi:hypothetical protein
MAVTDVLSRFLSLGVRHPTADTARVLPSKPYAAN